MDAFYTSVLLHNPQWYYPLICLAVITVALILAMIVFALKKKDRKKKKKGKGEIKEAADAVSAAVSSDPEISEILKESELTEGIIE